MSSATQPHAIQPRPPNDYTCVLRKRAHTERICPCGVRGPILWITILQKFLTQAKKWACTKKPLNFKGLGQR